MFSARSFQPKRSLASIHFSPRTSMAFTRGPCAVRGPACSPMAPPRVSQIHKVANFASESSVGGFSLRHGRCTAAQAVSSTSEGFAPPKETGSVRKLAEKEQRMVCDKLIKAFQSKPQNEWRTLIAYSKQWPTLADKVFSRCGQPLVTRLKRPYLCVIFSVQPKRHGLAGGGSCCL